MKKYDYAITAACFDLLHQGHINLLKKMKESADKVIVFLHDNKSIFENKGKFPVQNYEDRARNLKDCGLVNVIIKTESKDPSDVFYIILAKLKVLQNNKIIYVRGDDWKDFPGKSIIRHFKIPIEFVNYTKGISSTKLRDGLSKDL